MQNKKLLTKIRKNTLTVIASFGILAVMGSTGQAADQSTSTSEEKKVMSVINHMTDSFNKKSLDGIMETYESGAAVSFQPGMPMVGEDMLRKAFEVFFAFNPHYNFDEHEVVVAGDIALHTVPWSMTGKAPDGTTIQESGLSVAVLRKQKDGQWLMVIDNPHGSRFMDQ